MPRAEETQKSRPGARRQSKAVTALPIADPGSTDFVMRALAALFKIITEGSTQGVDRSAIMARLYSSLKDALPALAQHTYQKPPMIEKAPRLWSERDKSIPTNLAKFTREVYGPWIGQGLIRQRLGQLDRPLYKALSVWEARHPEDRIADLPTLAEVIDRKIAALSVEFTPDELRTLGTTLQARLARQRKRERKDIRPYRGSAQLVMLCLSRVPLNPQHRINQLEPYPGPWTPADSRGSPCSFF